jgi:hypothetical protein
MKVWVALFLVAVACDSGKQGPARTGAGSGSAGSGAAIVQPTPACTFDGTYRLRFVSNGAEGWWLYGKVAAGKLEITGGAVEMLGLARGPQPITSDLGTCSFTLAKHTERAGDLKLHVALDPVTGKITGNITRTDTYSVEHEANTPLTGVRETAPPKLPACLRPGVYELASDGKTRWKLSEGHPRFGLSCNDDSSPITQARVRVSVLGPDIIVDEETDEGQSFSRGVVKRDGDCAITLAYEKQDFRFAGAHLVFDGDRVSGTADTATYDFFENGEAGENLWKCSAAHVMLAGTRVGD